MSSSVITISQPPVVPGSSKSTDSASTETKITPFASETQASETEDEDILASSDSDSGDPEDKDHARQSSLEKLQSASPPPQTIILSPEKGKQRTFDIDQGLKTLRRRKTKENPDAVIVLKEEKVGNTPSCIIVCS